MRRARQIQRCGRASPARFEVVGPELFAVSSGVVHTITVVAAP